MTEKYKKIIEQYFENINAVNPNVFDVFAADFRYTVVGDTPASGTFTSLDDLMVNFAAFVEHLQGIKLHIKELVAEGSTVVARAQGESTTKEGKEYNNSYVLFFRFEGDKIVEVTEFMDTVMVETVVYGKKLV